MKKILSFLCLFFAIAISIFGQTKPHSDKAYVSNPELARQDALSYVEDGNIAKAIICYKKYAALTGKDMAATISELERNQYPDWYDATSMVVIPIDSSQMLVIHKELRACNAWEIPDSVYLQDIIGAWDVSINLERFKAILQSGLYIPQDGLYSGSVKLLRTIKKTFTTEQNGRVVDVKYRNGKDESLSVILITSNGFTSSIDCGYYREEPDFKEGRIIDLISDNRREIPIYYYPSRTICYINGAWQIKNRKKL